MARHLFNGCWNVSDVVARGNHFLVDQHSAFSIPNMPTPWRSVLYDVLVLLRGRQPFQFGWTGLVYYCICLRRVARYLVTLSHALPSHARRPFARGGDGIFARGRRRHHYIADKFLPYSPRLTRGRAAAGIVPARRALLYPIPPRLIPCATAFVP